MASMLSLSLSVLISTERRMLVHVVPDSMREVWDKWNLRVSVLISLLCQVILLTYGKSRKYSDNRNSLVWAAYLMSDWVANFALGVISSKVGGPVGSFGKSEDDLVLLAFWGTFLLVHLGGPPTITAEALEDNALWRRTLILWIVQTIRILYIILLAWRSMFSYFSICLLVVGFIRCGERTWALYYASTDNHHHFFPPLDLNIHDTNETQNSRLEKRKELATASEREPRVMFENFMRFFVCLFIDLVLSPEDLRREQSSFRDLGSKRAFERVEEQLGFAYDVFYTKAYVMSRISGMFLGLCASIIGTMMFPYFLVFSEKELHGLSKIDKFITWALMLGHYFQEIYTIFVNVYSIWNRETRSRSPYSLRYRRAIVALHQKQPQVIRKCNLLRPCPGLKCNDICGNFDDFKKLLDTNCCEIDENLTENIFKHFLKKSELAMEGRCPIRCGVHAALKAHRLKSIEWTMMLEFHQSILAWHIATNLCCYGIDDIQEHFDMVESQVGTSKTLSEYMLYLMVKQRHMLPIGKGLITFRDTFSEIAEILHQSKTEISLEAYRRLLQVNPNAVRRSRSNSVLHDACRLARSLINELEPKQRWEFLDAVWIEILGYAATHCRVDQHAQQLRKGGEFLTHVWLLMAQLGAMEQFQATKTPP